jgi:MFS family permease
VPEIDAARGFGLLARPVTHQDPRLERELSLMTREAVAFSAMVGLGETYVPAFALAVGLGDVTAGLVATLPVVAGGIFQLVTPWGVARLASYRRWVVACAVGQALSFVPLVAGALLGRLSLAWMFLATCAYWAFGMATGPAWNAWVGAVVPQERRAGFFARRARWGQAALLVAFGVGGVGLHLSSGIDPVLAFALLFPAAAAARLLSAGLLSRQAEPADLVVSHDLGPPWRGVRGVGVDARSLLFYLLAVQAAVYVAAPYFTPYMLGSLSLSYAAYAALTAAALVSRIAALPWLGRLSRRRGHRFLLWSGALGVVPLPALWLVSDGFAYLLAVQLVAGVAWAAFELATVLAFFEELEPGRRAGLLALFNLANALAMALGCTLGAQLLAALGEAALAYPALFVTSALARAACVPLLRRVPAAPFAPQAAPLRTLAVRPSLGAVQRPVLPALPGAEEDSAGAR